MQEQAKVSLSAFELQLVTDANIILTKNNIIQKVISLFSTLSNGFQQSHLRKLLPAEVLLQPSKISKGENYLGLPYVMLDYPKCFGKDDVFAIRTFFWWGNFFSITLHLKGAYKLQFEERICKAITENKLNGFYINTTNAEWEHDLSENYIPITHHVTFQTIKEKEVLKLVSKIELNKWEDAEVFLQKHFQKILELLVS